MSQSSLDKMVEAMSKTKHPSPDNGWTLGWDVVVSYSQKEINQVLHTAWEKHKDQMITAVKAEIEIPPDSDDEDFDDCDGDDNGEDGDHDDDEKYRKPTTMRTRSYDVLFGAPRIKFSGEAVVPAADLVIPFKSGSYRRSDRPGGIYPMPKNGYEFIVRNVQLGTITGTYQEVKNKRDLDIKGDCVFKKVPTGDVDGDFEVSWIVLDIKLGGRRLQVDVEKTYGDKCSSKRARFIDRRFHHAEDLAKAFFLGTSEDSFGNQFNTIRHALATIKNKRLPKQAGVTVDLTPKTFRLATCASTSILKEPILSLFIHVVDGKDAGEKGDLQTRWRSQLVSASPKIPPIPDTYTSSILIHPTLLYEKVLAESIITNASDNEWAVTRLPGREGGGISVHATYQKPFKQDTFYIKLPREDGDLLETTRGAPWLEVEGWSKNLKDIPMTVQLYQADPNANPVARVEWEFAIESQWQKTSFWGNGRENQMNRGEAMNNRTTLSIKHDFPLIIKTTDYDITFNIDEKEIEAHCTISDKWIHWNSNSGLQFKTDLDQELIRLSQKIFGDGNSVAKTDALAKRHAKILGVRPKFKFGSMGLGFFLTTNLLNPGSKVIDIDKNVGMRMPGNMLLVGHVIQGKDIMDEAAK